jgi:hypothetical protein
MEEVSSGPYLPESNGKYEVTRALAVSDQRSAISSENPALPFPAPALSARVAA